MRLFEMKLKTKKKIRKLQKEEIKNNNKNAKVRNASTKCKIMVIILGQSPRIDKLVY